MVHSLKVSFLAISAQFNLHQTFTFIHFHHFSIVFAIACFIALLYGILFSIWFTIINQTILAFKSGFFISLISRFIFFANFFSIFDTILSLFSQVLPRIKEDFAVYTTMSILS
ncbi:MAG: hypothetical protein LBQ24_04360 [Candidatus Peribacteria bacterium]|jgi:hypothetical protein|nr:hypothetical protein [Candidatus Peribacteria bacterium]